MNHSSKTPLRAIKNKPRTPRVQKRRSSSTKRSPGRKGRSSASQGLRWLLALGALSLMGVVAYYWYARSHPYRGRSCPEQEYYQVCLPDGYSIHGLDISHHQGLVDWDVLKKYRQGATPYPIHFVFMKATEGGDLTDSRFRENFAHAWRCGFLRGAYHFFTPGTDAGKQADFFIRTVKLEVGDLPPVLDIEVRGKKTVEQFQADALLWLRKVEAHYGVKPILYTSYKFKEKYLNHPHFDAYPYWIAHYYVDSLRYRGAWRFWQHTDVARVDGIDEAVDLNVFNGSLSELLKLTLQADSTVSAGHPPTQTALSDF